MKRMTVSVYIDNSVLMSRIKQWKYGGRTGTTLRTDYDLLQLSTMQLELAEELQIDLIPHHRL